MGDLNGQLPELTAGQAGLVRIPGELDVPVSKRVLAVLDTPAMQRLKRISQLGLVAHVYPGATHSRFEHSLGVYRLACQVLSQLLATNREFAESLSRTEAKTYLLAALVHDVGHWPYCHPIEDMRLEWVPKHERLARELICKGELAQVIAQQWQVDPATVAGFLTGFQNAGESNASRVLRSVLNGPVDIDKMDYLQRDSLHAGVPYGRNFDVGRLINSLCLGSDSRSLAITDKGKTAAEMMVFSRYVMFSEVYWHHAVRSATAMLQRLVYSLSDQSEPQKWLEQSDADFSSRILSAVENRPELGKLADSLFGCQRRLYKRVEQYNFNENSKIHASLAGNPYRTLVRVSEQLAERLSRRLKRDLSPTDILVDAPPEKLEVQFQIQVRSFAGHSAAPTFVSLASISPVVKALATEQFDCFVKQVRVFVAADRAEELSSSGADIAKELAESARMP